MRICSFWFKGCPTSHMMHQALRSKGYLPICLAGWLTRGRQTLPGSLLRGTEHARTNTLAARYLSDLLFLIQRVSHSISSGASRGRRNGRSPLNTGHDGAEKNTNSKVPWATTWWDTLFATEQFSTTAACFHGRVLLVAYAHQKL